MKPATTTTSNRITGTGTKAETKSAIVGYLIDRARRVGIELHSAQLRRLIAAWEPAVENYSDREWFDWLMRQEPLYMKRARPVLKHQPKVTA